VDVASGKAARRTARTDTLNNDLVDGLGLVRVTGGSYSPIEKKIGLVANNLALVEYDLDLMNVGGPDGGSPAWSKSYAGCRRLEKRLADARSLAFPLLRRNAPDAGQGRERTYFEHFLNDSAADRTHSVPEADQSCSIIEESYCENSALLLATSSLTVRIFWT
jgi:hypothetical protein